MGAGTPDLRIIVTHTDQGCHSLPQFPHQKYVRLENIKFPPSLKRQVFLWNQEVHRIFCLQAGNITTRIARQNIGYTGMFEFHVIVNTCLVQKLCPMLYLGYT